MVVFFRKSKNNHYFQASQMLSIIIYFLLYINIQSTSSYLSDKESLNKTLLKFNETLFNYNDYCKKMEKITLNIFLKIRFKDLQRAFQELDSNINQLKNKFAKNESITDNIILINKNIKAFRIKYNNAVNSYENFEETKRFILEFIKIFSIILSIIIVIVLIFIGVGSYLVIQNQKKKYHKLQEEVSIRNDQKDSDKETNIKDEIKSDNTIPVKSTQDDLVESNNNKNEKVALDNNNAISKEFLNNPQN